LVEECVEIIEQFLAITLYQTFERQCFSIRKNKIGVKTKERVHIMDSIFGEEGVLNSKDKVEG
jgi:hypothetical protein